MSSAGVSHRAHGHVPPTHAGRLRDRDVTEGKLYLRVRSLLPEAEKPTQGTHAARGVTGHSSRA